MAQDKRYMLVRFESWKESGKVGALRVKILTEAEVKDKYEDVSKAINQGDSKHLVATLFEVETERIVSFEGDATEYSILIYG